MSELTKDQLKEHLDDWFADSRVHSDEAYEAYGQIWDLINDQPDQEEREK